MSMMRCGDCQFWKGQQQPAEAQPRGSVMQLQDPDLVDGICRLNPPVPHPIAGRNPITGEPMMGSVGLRPPMKAGDGCGQGEAIPAVLNRLAS